MTLFKYRMDSFEPGVKSVEVDAVPLSVVQIEPPPDNPDRSFVQMRCTATAERFRAAARDSGVLSQKDIDAGRVEVTVDITVQPPEVNVILNRIDAFTFERQV
jgi:hypothetical protein